MVENNNKKFSNLIPAKHAWDNMSACAEVVTLLEHCLRRTGIRYGIVFYIGKYSHFDLNWFVFKHMFSVSFPVFQVGVKTGTLSDSTKHLYISLLIFFLLRPVTPLNSFDDVASLSSNFGCIFWRKVRKKSSERSPRVPNNNALL